MIAVRAVRRMMTALALLATVAACAVGPKFQRPAPPKDTGYGTASAAPEAKIGGGRDGDSQRLIAGLSIPAQWWRAFESEPLDRLVEQSLRSNPTLGAAEASLRQTRELFLAQRASLWPSIQGGASASRARNANLTLANPTISPTAVYSLYTAQLSLSYTPDVFGGGRRAVESAKAAAEASRFEYEATYVTLASNVVVAVVQDAALRGQLAAIERLRGVQRQLTEMTLAQRKFGSASDLDVLTQQASEAETATLVPPLEKQLGQNRDALTALLGRLPASEPMETFGLNDLSLPAELPVSVPSELVEHRPDVRQAEANMHAASAQVGVTLAGMLPQFAITADTGSAALVIHQLFKPYSGFWDAGASLTQVLFDAGALRHRKRAAEAALDGAAAQYRAAVILACQNVADTLRALRADADAADANAEARKSTASAFELAKKQREIGAISEVTLLAAEQAYLQAQVGWIQARANRLSDAAALYQALGGGWWNRTKEGPHERSDPSGE